MESSVLFSGIFDLPWWGYVVAALGLTHITIVSVTVFLHRHQAHRALDLHPLASHFFRLWLWMTTGMVARSRSESIACFGEACFFTLRNPTTARR